jgi:leader peptidase (prepilin peptidase) / N-methyltransferase
MREVVFALIGIASGYKAISRARVDIARYRQRGEVFGESHFTDHSVSTAFVMAIGAALYAALANRFTHDLTALTFGVLVSAGMWLTLIDIDTHLLPRRIVYRTTSLVMPLLIICAFFDDAGSVLGMFVGAFALWMVMRVLEVLARGGLGGGDVALAGLLGLYLGWLSYEAVVVGLIIAFMVGGVFALLLLITRRANRSTRFAFGPFLIVGALVAVLR